MSERQGSVRVLLWNHDLMPEVAHHLEGLNVEFVGSVHIGIQGVKQFRVADFLDGRIPVSPMSSDFPDIRPTDQEFRTFCLGIGRIGLTPFAHLTTFHDGGLVGVDEIEGYARMLVHQSLSILKETKPDQVWFVQRPHLGVDQAMMIAARIAGITAISFRQLPFPEKFLCEVLEGGACRHLQARGAREWVHGATELNLFYMQSDSSSLTDRIQLDWFSWAVRRVAERDFGRISGKIWELAKDRQWRGIAALIGMLDGRTRRVEVWESAVIREHYSARNMRKLFDVRDCAGPFVYFALHLEPEANVDIYGETYSFQVDALRSLASILPANWLILLKENPKQRHPRRTHVFYHAVSCVDRVRWVSDDSSTEVLIERCTMVASVNGTVGYEALLKGKVCVYFGDAWYSCLPGAHRFCAELDLAALTAAPVCRESLNKSVDMLLSRAHDGVVSSRYMELIDSCSTRADVAISTARSLSRIAQDLAGGVTAAGGFDSIRD